MAKRITPKKEMIEFINENLYIEPKPKDLTLREIKSMLENVIHNREDKIHHDEWIDDVIIGIAQEYIDELTEDRIRAEDENISQARNVSEIVRKSEKLPKLPLDIERKIQTYVVETPDNPKSEFGRITKNGGKSKKNKRKSRSRKRKNKRKTRRHRQSRK